MLSRELAERCRYSLPEHVSRHVDYVTPGVALSAPLEKTPIERRWGPSPWPHPAWPFPHWPKPNPWWRHRPYHPPPGSGSLPPNLQTCGFNMTPACIRALYDLPSPAQVASEYNSGSGSGVGAFELYSVYNQTDLNLFFQKFAPQVPQGTHPILDSIEGARIHTKHNFPGLSSEANIDFDILYSLLYPQTIT